MSRIRNTLKEELIPKICSSLEDTSRRVVREELEHASSQSAQLVRSSGKCRKKDEVRNLQLQFKTRLSLPLFTGQKLEGEHGAPIVVILINANTGDIVESGPESSVKLDVVVIDGDFKKEDDDYWTKEEFEKYVVKEREGKRPLLTGNLEVILKGGTGVLGELAFTDNSSWNRSKKFRLGLRVSPGYCENIRICEAKTEAFTVKEHRGESYKKHYPPASDDEVWRLANIAKDGSSHKRLNEAGIYKVEEFLRQLSMDSKKLRNILGKGMTDKKWKVLLDHAKTCTLNGKLYVYYHDNESDHAVILNNVGQLSGLAVNGVFCTIDRFSPQQKDYADRLAKKAYENWNDVRQFDAEASSSSMSEKISCSFLSEVLGDQQCCHPVHDNMPPPRLASQVGLKVPPRSSASTVEENSGITAARLPTQSQGLNSQNGPSNQFIDCIDQIEPSADKNVPPFGQAYESPSSFLAFDIEDNGIDWQL
ncbi:calmodulin-binding protein 60 D-like [Syzygium oleosum]|uniref:calmodulin-binding protein 60 D-like n=1 Tax=Syzygium oleosum TaxID=219896 RepID=UPI0024B87D72|nr:calmodulin-binding protein 60 D-like [Syzygium oleosum]